MKVVEVVSQLVVGSRIIYCHTFPKISYHVNIKQSSILEISPSGKYIKLEDYGWLDINNSSIDILEVFKDRSWAPCYGHKKLESEV